MEPQTPLRLVLRGSAPNHHGHPAVRELQASVSAWPQVTGEPITVSFRAELYAFRGQLVASGRGGVAVYAACFIRERHITFERGLASNRGLLRFIFWHELAHFRWVRMSNRERLAYERVLHAEWEDRRRGEIGESALIQKERLSERAVSARQRPWREYVCESFCDTAAWLRSEGDARAPAACGLARGCAEERRAALERLLATNWRV